MQKTRNKFLKDIKSIFRELLLYSYNFIQKKSIPTNKFIILGTPRSGSTLLVDLLNSHPNIYCENEILFPRKLFPRLFIYNRSKLFNERIYGFKLLVSHFRFQPGIKDPTQFISELYASGFKIIKIQRENKKNESISLLYSKKIGTFHQTYTDTNLIREKVKINPSKMLCTLKWMEELNNLLNNICRQVSSLDILYEDDLENKEDHQRTADKIFNYLEVSSVPVQSSFVKICPNDLSDLIINFNEINEILSHTK